MRNRKEKEIRNPETEIDMKKVLLQTKLVYRV